MRPVLAAPTVVVPQTCTSSGAWVQVDFDVSAYADHSVTIAFHNHDDNNAADPTYTWVDNVALNSVTNGGFERGALTAWTSTGQTSMYLTGGTPAVDGAWAAMVGRTSASTDSTLAQTFTIPNYGVANLAFTYKIVCPDTITYDQVWVTLYDNTTSTSYTVIPQTCSNTGSWSNVNYSIANLLGHSVTLTFHNHDDNVPADPTYSLFDNVTFN